MKKRRPPSKGAQAIPSGIGSFASGGLRHISDAATLVLSPGAALFVGAINDTKSHRHHAAQLTMGLDGPFGLQLRDRELQCRAVYLAPNLTHRLYSTGGMQAVLLVEPESAFSRSLRAPYSADCVPLNLPDELYADLARAAHEAGFADSAHMSRTFKAMFGIKPSELFTNSRSVQVFLELSR